MTDPNPVIADCAPVELELKPGEYWWCSCGKSNNQPFCDGSHREDRVFSPMRFEIKDRARSVKLCLCKYTKTSPYCDQTHRDLDECAGS